MPVRVHVVLASTAGIVWLILHLTLQGLLTEGLEVEMCPASLSITPLLPQSVKVMVKPRTPGQLRVLGEYSLVSSQAQPAHRHSLVSSQ